MTQPIEKMSIFARGSPFFAEESVSSPVEDVVVVGDSVCEELVASVAATKRSGAI